MSFATSLALLVGLLVGLPITAHLLRRGKTQEQPFPPAHLVPAAVVTSEQRSRIEDRFLLLLRALMVLFLAILGATPFVRCSHLSVDRPSGASVALALVIDDSQSMRAVNGDGASRFELAKKGALQLLDSAREGDAVAIVGAGAQARLLLNATTDLSAARDAVRRLAVSDRATDLANAVVLARSALRELPHGDKRVVLLSDLADGPIPDGTPALWTPLAELSTTRPNCGIAQAVRQGAEVSVTLGCNDEAAVKGRRLELLVADESQAPALDELPLESHPGTQVLTFAKATQDFELSVRLTGSDAIESDNRATVGKESAALTVAVLTDRAETSGATGGAPLVEQALGALDPDLALKPLSQLPETADGLRGFAAIIIDNPPGLSPELRAALDTWLNQGGVLLGLLGPNSVSAELASSIEPFARPGAQWERNQDVALDTSSLSFLGSEAASLSELRQVGRVRLDAADLPGTRILGKWQDGVPWLFERAVGAGVVLTVGLPTSLSLSEMALRPGFLGLLDQVLTTARRRSGPKRTEAGVAWRFPATASLSVKPLGDGTAELKPEVVVAEQTASDRVADDSDSAAQQEVVPAVAGDYQVVTDGREEQRTVTLNPLELTRVAAPPEDGTAVKQAAAGDSSVDASPHWAMLLLGLFALELAVRVWRSSSRRLQET